MSEMEPLHIGANEQRDQHAEAIRHPIRVEIIALQSTIARPPINGVVA